MTNADFTCICVLPYYTDMYPMRHKRSLYGTRFGGQRAQLLLADRAEGYRQIGHGHFLKQGSTAIPAPQPGAHVGTGRPVMGCRGK